MCVFFIYQKKAATIFKLRLITAAVVFLFLSSDSCDLTIDTNTVNRNLKLCESNRKVTHVEEEKPYPDHPDRFDFWPQLMCENALTGRCYWEVEWTGRAYISLSYRGMSRRGDRENCRFGENDRSWSLDCFDSRPYSFCHNKTAMLSSSPFYYSFPHEPPYRFYHSSSHSSSTISCRVAFGFGLSCWLAVLLQHLL